MKKNVLILEECIAKRYESLNVYKEFTHIRGFHGCRPISGDEYYKRGICPIKKQFAKKEALLRLCDERVPEERVSALFEDEWEKLEYPHRSVWFAISLKELMDYCGHYLIYGSEFLCGMATKLLCSQNLKRIGVPTIFLCDVPLDGVPKCYIEEINGKVADRDGSGGFRVTGSICHIKQ